MFDPSSFATGGRVVTFTVLFAEGLRSPVNGGVVGVYSNAFLNFSIEKIFYC